jgi:CheY-like chemotaxis protein
MGEAGGTLEVGLEDVNFETETKISDELLKEGSYVKLSVSDTGCGMEKEVMERIFEPFFTTKKVNEGTGLGLPVVHGIITSHGGAIAVNSASGQGTTFEIFLPRIESNQIQEQQTSEPEIKDKEVIFLIDDEEMMVDVTGKILERLGYAVVTKTNSIEAMEMFQENPDKFDLVIADQVMPNMTGLQLAQNMLSLRPNIPVIICTGFPENISIEEAKNIGVKELIFKPLSREEIASIVRSVLDNSKISV